jgi:hypothetical protein
MFLPMRGGFGYADPSGSLPHLTQFANCRKARRAAAPILGCAAFPLADPGPFEFASSRSSWRSEAAISTSRIKRRAIPKTTFRKYTGFEIPQMRVVDSTPPDRILKVAELSTSSLGAARP